MKISIYMIKEALPSLHLQGHLISDLYALPISRPLVVDPAASVWKEDILYVTSREVLSHMPIPPILVSVLCAGMPPSEWISSNNNVLYTLEALSIVSIMNLLLDKFDLYWNWEQQLQDVIDNNGSLHDMLQVSFSFIQNPIYAYAAGYQMLCYAFPDMAVLSRKAQEYQRANEVYAKQAGELSEEPEAISELLSNDEYMQTERASTPMIFSGNPFENRTLFYNIRINGVFIARVCIDEVCSPIRDRDYALIQILGRYMGKSLGQKRQYFRNRYKHQDAVLKKLLSHILVPEKQINELIRNYLWQMNDTYCCVTLKHITSSSVAPSLDVLAENLTSQMASECFVVFDDFIVFICNLSSTHTDFMDFNNKLVPVFRDNLLKASFSSPYNDFKNLYYYYHQARDVLLLGERNGSTKWIFQSDDIQLLYMLHTLKQATIYDVFIPQGLKRLIEYDESNQTEYVQLLRSYLEEERNIAHTIRRTFMHRNTFLYRMKKIENILQMDLDDSHVRMLLLMSFCLMDEDSDIWYRCYEKSHR